MAGKWWRFYETATGGKVVRKELDELSPAAKGAVSEALSRRARDEHLPYEEEHIDGRLRAVRVFLDGATYRVLYATVGNRDRVLLGLHVIQKKDRKLPVKARRLALKRLADWEGRSR